LDEAAKKDEDLKNLASKVNLTENQINFLKEKLEE
jgi:hypothetical protein